MKRAHREIVDSSCGNTSYHRPQKFRRCSGSEASVYPGNISNKWNAKSRDSSCSTHKCVPTQIGGHRCCPESLTDLASKVCAASTPFQLVEDRCTRVPDPVMQKLIYWSFPRHESDIRRYSALSCEKFNQTADGLPGQAPATSAPSVNRTGAENAPNNLPTLPVRNPEGPEQQSPEDAMTSFNNLGVVTSAELEGLEIPFEQGVAMAETGKVKEALQIGFHLSGTVEYDGPDAPLPVNSYSGRDSPISFHVAITFDRCKITSATCDCKSGDIFFCRHVVALSIYRIRKPNMVTIRSPISDTLQQMSRDQLQKLTQYLLAHHSRVLPAAQRVADLLVDPNSDMNAVNGAPDPTAGAGLRDEDRWSLEDVDAAKHVSSLLRSNEKQESSIHLQSLLAKVREMLRARDCNGSRLLTLITDELMRHCSTHTHVPTIHQSPPQPDVCRMMWDQLGLLWVCVVLNPRISSEERESFVKKLKDWGSQHHCPPESGEEAGPQRSGQPVRTGRNVLSRAVDAGSMRWDDPHLKRILDNEVTQVAIDSIEKQQTTTGSAMFDSEGRPVWHEHVPTACARVEALRSHGCEKESVALACAIARTIKQKWIDNFKLHQRKPINEGPSPPMPRSPLSPGLIGHPLHPIHILFDTLTGSGADDVTGDTENEEGGNTQINGKEWSSLCTAYEVALLTLGQQRLMPEGPHNQEKMLASEVALIRRLQKLTLAPEMVSILRNVCQILVDGGPTSGLGEPVRRDSVPLHSLAKYLFHSLLPNDRQLAFRVGIRAMQTPVLHRYESNFYREAYAPPPPPAFSFDPTHVPEQQAIHHHEQMRYHAARQHHGPSMRWYIMDKLEENQCALASALIQTAKGEVLLLREVVESVQRNVGNPAHIFQLSHDAYKAATPPVGTPDSSMLNVALQMGMQVLRMTIHGGSWRRAEMVGWLVTCATEIGLCALISIIKSWYTLFSPVEATTMVANCVVSPNTAMRLNLDPRQRDELFHCVCQMSLQCAVKDPQSCALSCLTLCESVPSAFDASYHVILDSSNKRRIDASNLYTISRYLEQRGLRTRAFTVAFAATRCLTIAFNHDTHPAISDLLWTMQLAQSLGRNELTQMVSVVSRNIKCASVLSEVLRTCTSGVNSRETTNLAHFGERSLRADGPILRPLLEVAISAYVSTIHSKLSHISPRHYTEFIDFLNKARETFLLASNGHARFAHLKANLKMVYKGKKKLLNLVTLRFG